MNNPEEIKRMISPIVVAQHYLGQPNKSGNRYWYKAPWRNERTASLMVDEKAFHDFGENWHGDIIDFVGKYYNTDFITSMKILSRDFGLPESERISTKLEQYLKQKRDEEQQMKINLEKWYCKTLNDYCDKFQKWKNVLPYLKGAAYSIIYSELEYLDYIIDEFINATEEEKFELWKMRRKQNGK